MIPCEQSTLVETKVEKSVLPSPVLYIEAVDLFLTGSKGLMALRVALKYPAQITSVRLRTDPGVLDDPYELMLNLSRENHLHIPPNINETFSDEALAVGWKSLIAAPYQRLFVVHDSLLPKYRGWNPLVTALQNQDSSIGATLFLADDQMDKGPIVRQVKSEISYPMRITDAMVVVEQAIETLVESLFEQVDRQDLPTKIQQEDFASYSIWRDDEDYRIDWTKSAKEILLFVDSVSYPYKGAFTFLNGKMVRILKVDLYPDVSVVNRVPGKVFRLVDNNPVVLCGSGALKITEAFLEEEPSRALELQSIRSRFCS